MNDKYTNLRVPSVSLMVIEYCTTEQLEEGDEV